MTLNNTQKQRAYNRLNSQLKTIYNDYKLVLELKADGSTAITSAIYCLNESLRKYGDFWKETNELCPEVASQFPLLKYNKNGSNYTFYMRIFDVIT